MLTPESIEDCLVTILVICSRRDPRFDSSVPGSCFWELKVSMRLFALSPSLSFFPVTTTTLESVSFKESRVYRARDFKTQQPQENEPDQLPSITPPLPRHDLPSFSNRYQVRSRHRSI